jgi:glucose/arabinose dehydrogenase
MSLAARLACLAVVTVALLALSPVASAQPTAPPDAEFEKVTLNDEPGEPMDLAVLPDGRVLHVTRPGVVWLHDPTNGVNSIAAELDVYQHDEEGLQNVALDPNFERNRWVYLYYSPPLDTPLDDPSTLGVNEGDAPSFGTQADWDRFKGFLRLSRFKFQRDKINLSTEQMIIEVPVDRGICCHVGGDILFDGDRNL